jgi:hypothetical protein
MSIGSDVETDITLTLLATPNVKNFVPPLFLHSFPIEATLCAAFHPGTSEYVVAIPWLRSTHSPSRPSPVSCGIGLALPSSSMPFVGPSGSFKSCCASQLPPSTTAFFLPRLPAVIWTWVRLLKGHQLLGGQPATSRAGLKAARHGHLHVLRWLEVQLFPWREITILQHTARGGHVHVMCWLNYDWLSIRDHSQIAHIAVSCGHIPLLRYLAKQPVSAWPRCSPRTASG